MFGRPIAKVFLGAVFTYQVTYWIWVKLEKDDLKAQKIGEVSVSYHGLGTPADDRT